MGLSDLLRRAKATKHKPGFSTPQELERLALVRAQFFQPERLRGLDLFAGAGGFTIGALQEGCPVIGVEYNERAVQTGRRAGHDVLRMDVRQTTKRSPKGLPMDLMIGGPPCQPFSSAGKRKGEYDPREGFQLALQAVDAWRPTRLVLENVKEFLASEHTAYREQIIAALRQRYAHVGAWLLNARDYGVPQDRWRVFIWAAERELAPPPATHGPGAGRPYVTTAQALPGLLHEGFRALMAFQVRAISRTTQRQAPTVTTARNLYAVTREGFTYRGAGSVPQGQRRLLTPEEIQALQSFPATFGFVGNMKERTTQIGNAVPPPLAANVVAAATVGLRPRTISPGELLDTFRQLDEQILVHEPRPWTDEALIGVTTMKAEAPGALVPVYDSAKLKDSVFYATRQWAAQRQGASVQQLSYQALEQAENQALGYLSADKQRHPALPVIVPVATLRELGLPPAVMLLPGPERMFALMAGASAKQGQVLSQDDAQQLLLEISSEHGEIFEF